MSTDGYPRIVLLENGVLVRDYHLDKEIVTIGRASVNDISLHYIPVSRTHAQILRVAEDRYLLKDLGSKNGTLVNGARIREHGLKHGDRIGLGKYTLVFWYAQEPQPEETKPENE
ncbi:MAG: FHA domain-containing protein [Magnetococcales bacterium]|nr:FHA domain-containing protein [Magnetococcales bacterium]